MRRRADGAIIGGMIFRWDEFELDEEAGELRRRGERIEVQPKPFELLHILLREHPRTVPADELMRALWPDVAVTPSSLNRAVSHARRAIGDTHRGARIQSVARRGYRFTGPLRDASADADQPFATPFVGRTEALASLRAALRGARRGAGSLLLVSGPAGIGKTRLLRAFAEESERAGVRCFAGHCRDREGAPAYWVWSQVLRALREGHDTPGVQALRGQVDRLARAADGGPQSSASLAPEQNRFLLFEAVSEALHEAARAQPFVILLEDIQWAGEESLELLEHVAFDLARGRFLIVASLRDEALARRRPVERTRVALRRLEHCHPIELQRLTPSEVGELLERLLGRPAPPEWVAELASRTEGVPLFLREWLRSLHASGELHRPVSGARPLPLAAASLSLLRRALDGLPERCLAVLEAGAVLGREFSLPLAAEVASISRDEAAQALDRAALAGVVEAAEAAAHWRFSHALYREALYDGIVPGRRATLHRQAAEAIERRAVPDPLAAAAELSHHCFEALAVADPEATIRFAEHAASQAMARLSWEEAALHLRRAATAIDHLDPPRPEQKLDALIRLGESQALAREPDNRRSTLLEAAALAKSLDHGPSLVRAAIAYCDLSEWSPHDPEAAPLLESALARVDPAEHAARAALETRLAYRHIRAERAHAQALARDALALARTTGDPLLVQEAVYVLLFSLAGPDQLDLRASLRRELEEAARRTPRRDAALIALLDLACDRLTLGDGAAARELRGAAEALVGASPHPGLRWHLATYDAGLAALEGRFEEGERLAREALRIGQRARHPYAAGCFDMQIAQLAFEQGDPQVAVERFAPLIERPRARTTTPIHWMIAFVGRAELARGEEGRARALWQRLEATGFSAIPRDIRWSRTLAEVAHLAAELGAAERAAELVALIEPRSDQHGVLPIPIGYGGPLRYGLGRLYARMGQRERAAEAFRRAAEDAQRVGALGWRERILREGTDAARESRSPGRSSGRGGATRA